MSTAFGFFGVLSDFIKEPRAIYLKLNDEYVLKIASLLLWAASFSRFAAQQRSVIISQFFSGSSDSPEYFTIASTPLVGEVISIAEMLYLLILCIPTAKYWARNLTSMEYEKTLEIFMVFTALVIVVTEGGQLLFNYIVTLNGVDREAYFLTRKFRVIIGFASLFLLFPMFYNLRALNKITSFKILAIGVIIWLLFQVVGAYFKFYLILELTKSA
jgi:hypothetical protein